MRRLVCFLLTLLVLGGAWAILRPGQPVMVVIARQGDAQKHRAGRPASTRQPMLMLDSLGLGDTLYLPGKSSLTVSVLASGTRYQLTGPLELPISADLKAGKGIVALDKQPGRDGILATQSVDLSKYGGVSGRYIRVFTDEATPLLDLDLLEEKFQSSSLKVYYRATGVEGPWLETQATLIHHSAGRDQLRLADLQLQEDKTYLVFVGDGVANAERAQYGVTRLPARVLEGVREQQKVASDIPAKIELYQSYLNLGLFIRAEELLGQMERDYPKDFDWQHAWTIFNEARSKPDDWRG